MTIFLDTCIIIDMLLDRKPFSQYAAKVFEKKIDGELNILVSSKQLTDIYYIISKFTHDTKKSLQIVIDFSKMVEIVDTKATDCTNAFFSNIKDYEDAIIEEIAFRLKADYIITRNIKDFVNSRVKIIDKI